MSRYSRLEVLNNMMEVGLIPIFYHQDPELTTSVIKACLDGGVRCFEFTNRGDCAHEVFSEVEKSFKSDSRLILGAGTIIEPMTCGLYIQLGANFIVGPNLNSKVAYLCNRRKIAYSPGCGSVSEISQAEELGVEICKIFPGTSVGGQTFVKNVLGPMPWSRLMPTGGVDVTEDNINSWFKAGVACVGIGSKLFTKNVIDNKNYSVITERVISIISWIKKARSE